MTPEARRAETYRKLAMRWRNMANAAIWDAQDYKREGRPDELIRSRVAAARKHNHRSIRYRRGEDPDV